MEALRDAKYIANMKITVKRVRMCELLFEPTTTAVKGLKRNSTKSIPLTVFMKLYKKGKKSRGGKARKKFLTQGRYSLTNKFSTLYFQLFSYLS